MFKNNFSLNQIALEMWEKLGYREIDTSVLSRVITGERLLNIKQIEVFSQILDLSKEEKDILEKSYLLDILDKYGLSEYGVDSFYKKFIQNKVEENKHISKFDLVRDEYWPYLINQKNSEEKALEFWEDCRARFWSGEYNVLLSDLLSLEKYIYQNNLLKTKAGRNFASASIAVRGDIYCHKAGYYNFLSFYKADDEIKKVKALVGESSKLYILATCSWGAVMRLSGESISKIPGKDQESLDMLIKSLIIRKESLEKLKDDSEKASLCSELASSASAIETLFPDRLKMLMDNKSSSSNFFSEAFKFSNEKNSVNISMKACIIEFETKWKLAKTIKKDNLLSGSQKEFIYDRIRDNFDKIKKLLDKSKTSRTVSVNTAVTEHLAYKYFEGKESEELKGDALYMILKTSDTRKANLLLQGSVY